VHHKTQNIMTSSFSNGYQQQHNGNNRYRSTGGLLFITSALSALVLIPSTAALLLPSPLGRARNQHTSIATTIKQHYPSIATTTSLHVGNTASAAPQQNNNNNGSNPNSPLATEGDWSAYLDSNYRRVYYFNHNTGESLWQPPTPTFPDVSQSQGSTPKQQVVTPQGRQQEMGRPQQGGGPMNNGPQMRNPKMDGNPQQMMGNPQMNMMGGPPPQMDGPGMGNMMGGPEFDGPGMMGMGGGPMDDMMFDPRMMEEMGMMPPGGGGMQSQSFGMRGGPPPPPGMQQGVGPEFVPPQQQQQQQPQQQGFEPTFYELLQVPPTATRSQIKQSYLNLAKQYDNANSRGQSDSGIDNSSNVGPQRGSGSRGGGGGRRSKEFNEIARAWMVLSDGRSRERYDRQLEQWNAERRMRDRMRMEEERNWMMEEQEQQMQQQQQGRVSPRGADNKFSSARASFGKKNPDMMGGSSSNKFGRFRSQEQSMPQPQDIRGRPGQQPPQGRDGFGGRPLEIDEAAEAYQFAQEEANYMAQQQEEAAVRSMYDEKKRNDDAQQEDMKRQRKEQFREDREREEKRRMGSERNVIQDKPQSAGSGGGGNSMPWMQSPMQQKPMQPTQATGTNGPQDMNVMMDNMKKKFAQKKMTVDEAARVKEKLSSLGGAAQQQQQPAADEQPKKGRSGVLFPGKGGIVVEDSDFVAKDILIDDYMKREPSFISWVPPENEEKGEAPQPATGQPVNKQQQQQQQGPPPPMSGGPPMSGEKEREQERLRNIRDKGVTGRQPSSGRSIGGPDAFGKTSSRAREQERLNEMRGMGVGIPGQPFGPSSAGVERTTLRTERPGVGGRKSSSTLREQERLKNMGAKGGLGGVGVGGPSNSQQPAGQPINIQQLKETHRIEMANLKREMEKDHERTLEEEIVKIAKIHAAEITKLQDEFEASQQQTQAPGGIGPEGAKRLAEMENAMQQMKMNHAAERNRMKEEITRELERENTEKMQMMEAAHKAEIDAILANQQGSGGGNGEEVTRLQSEIGKLKQAHSEEMESMAANHGQAMTQLRNELESKATALTKGHQLEIEKLKKDQKAVSVADTLKFQEVAMEKLGAQHKQEVDSLIAKHNRDMDKLRQDLEAKSVSDVNVKVEEATNEMAAKFKADIDKMAAQHQQDMQSTLQRELDNLHQQHTKELEAALAEKKRTKLQAAHVSREFKNADKQGGMTKDQKIDMVLKGFEGVYDPSVINQIRQDLSAQDVELEKKISDSTKQISMLQSKLDSSMGVEENLKNEIKKLTQWKQSAESELQRVRQGTDDKSKEAASLNNSIQKMNKEISDLKSQLDRLTQDKDSSKKEIWELREWKKNAEAERQSLERELKSKDGVIEKLKYDYNERNEDVNMLVPEVARLQELTASLETLIDKRSVEFESMKQEADRLKLQYEKESKSAADMAQSLKSALTNEQSKNSQLIANLKDDIKSKEREIANIQSTASQRARTIDDMKSKLEAYQKESERVVDEGKKRLATMTADFERQLANTKDAHQTELKKLETKLQNDIQHLQHDLSSRSSMIANLEKKLDSASSSIKNLNGEIVGLNKARHSTESLLKKSSHDLNQKKQEVDRLRIQVQEMKQFDATNTAKINALEKELSEKATALNIFQSGAKEYATEKELLLEELRGLKQWRDTAQATINTLSSEVAFNGVSEGKIDQVIQKLSSIRDELQQKDAQINYAASSTDALLKSQPATVSSTQNVGGTTGNASRSSYASKPMPDAIGSGFGSRQKNYAAAKPITSGQAYEAALASSGKELLTTSTSVSTTTRKGGYGKGGGSWKTASKGQTSVATPQVTVQTPLKGEATKTAPPKGFGFGKGGASWKTSQPKKSGGGGYLDNMSP